MVRILFSSRAQDAAVQCEEGDSRGEDSCALKARPLRHATDIDYLSKMQRT